MTRLNGVGHFQLPLLLLRALPPKSPFECALYSIISILGITWVWAIPTALITAELVCLFPTNAGFCKYAYEAFSPFWGFFVWYITLISNMICMSVAITSLAKNITVGILLSLGMNIEDYIYLIPIILGITLLLSFGFHLSGLKSVGDTLVLMIVLVSAPIIYFVLMGMWQVNVVKWTETIPIHEIKWSALINTVFFHFLCIIYKHIVHFEMFL